MKKWSDPIISSEANLPLAWIVFSLSGSIVVLVAAIYCLFLPINMSSIYEKLIVAIFIFVVYKWVKYLTSLILNGSNIVRSIYISENDIEIEDALHRKKSYNHKDLLSLDFSHKPWLGLKYSNSIKHFPNFNILFNKDAFYRIGKNMNEFEELKDELGSIIKANKLNEEKCD